MAPFYLSSAPTIFRKPAAHGTHSTPCSRIPDTTRSLFPVPSPSFPQPPPPSRLRTSSTDVACFSCAPTSSCLPRNVPVFRGDQLVPFFLRKLHSVPSETILEKLACNLLPLLSIANKRPLALLRPSSPCPLFYQLFPFPRVRNYHRCNNRRDRGYEIRVVPL